jgi:hypothetical protein
VASISRSLTFRRTVLAGLEVALILAALLSVPLTIVEVNGQNGVSFQVADWTVWAVFAVEYASPDPSSRSF